MAILGPTLPDIKAKTGASDLIALVFLVSIGALGRILITVISKSFESNSLHIAKIFPVDFSEQSLRVIEPLPLDSVCSGSGGAHDAVDPLVHLLVDRVGDVPRPGHVSRRDRTRQSLAFASLHCIGQGSSRGLG